MSETRRVTLSDVATQAGVSVTTASYILNGRSEQMRISEDAADRVRAAAAQLSYRPNRNARSLRTSSTAAIGLISDHVASGQYASQMLSGASSAALEGNHVLVIGETEGDPVVERRLVEEMLDRRVDGIVYSRLTTAEVVVPDVLRQQRVILLNCLDRAGEFPSVIPDEFEGGRTAARALIDAGRGAGVVVIGEDPDPFVIAGPERLRGVTQELESQGYGLQGVAPCAWSVIPAYDATMDYLDRHPVPSGVVCLNDRIAMGALQAFDEHRIRIPDEVAIVSFDGSELATWLRPSVSSVAIPYADAGALAVEMMLRGATGIQRLPMTLIQGKSI